MDGIINLLKPPGLTSHDAVGIIRRLTAIRQCGHAGTLDPGAAGVLPVLVGKATRVAEYMLEMDKSYRAEVTLGTATDSEDASGAVVKQQEIPVPDEKKVLSVFDSFTGTIDQVPPMHSALKMGGVRLYRLAREGKTVERKPRRVTIYSLTLLKLGRDKILFAVACSRGTYVRTLCADIAVALGTCGHMSFLLRERVGPFGLSESFTLEELTVMAKQRRLREALRPTDLALASFPALTLPEGEIRRLVNGGAVELSQEIGDGQLLRVYGKGGEFVALAAYSAGRLFPKKVFLNRMERA